MVSLKELIENNELETLLKNFEEKIIKRGQKYYERGKVIESYILSDNYLHGVVEGSEIYFTDVFMYKGKLYVNCTCPYDGNCKHAVALLFSLLPENEEDFKDINLDKFRKNIEKSLDNYGFIEFNEKEWKNLIKKYDKEEILNFLIDLTIYVAENFVYADIVCEDNVYVDDLVEIFLESLHEGERGKYLYKYLAGLGEDYEFLIKSPGRLFRVLGKKDIEKIRELIKKESPIIAHRYPVCAFADTKCE